MHWGFDVAQDTLKMDYVAEPWFHEDAAFDVTYPSHRGKVFAYRDALWHLNGREVHYQREKRTFTRRLEHDAQKVTASEEYLYYHHDKDVYRVDSGGERVVKRLEQTPLRMWATDAGLVYETQRGVFTEDGTRLSHDMLLLKSDGGVLAGVTTTGLKIWYAASWQMHHRMHVVGQVVDMALTRPWVCVVTERGVCTVWNVETGKVLRTWSVPPTRAVAIDAASNVTSVHAGEIRFYDDTSSCIYAQRGEFQRVLTTHEHVWVRRERWCRSRPVDTHMHWPVHLCLWCEAPLERPFPAPPEFVIKSVSQMLDDLRAYWLPQSLENMTSEHESEYAESFGQLVDRYAWSAAFFEYASERPWTRFEARQAVRRLRAMNVDIDAERWAAIDKREASPSSFALWDVLCDIPGAHVNPIVIMACAHDERAWLAGRAREVARTCVHARLIPFIPPACVRDVLEHKLTEWIPVVLTYMVNKTSANDIRRWRTFCAMLVDHNALLSFPQALAINDQEMAFQPTTLAMEEELLRVPAVLAKHMDVLLRIATPTLHVVYEWVVDAKQACIVAAGHDEMILMNEDRIMRRDMLMGTCNVLPYSKPKCVSVCDDLVACLFDDRIDILRVGSTGVETTFGTSDTLLIAFQNPTRLWCANTGGELSCYQAVSGDKLQEAPILHERPEKLRCDDHLILITFGSVYVYDLPLRMKRHVAAPHVRDALYFTDKLLFSFDDNTLCFDFADPFVTTTHRPAELFVWDDRLIVCTAFAILVYDDMGSEVARHEFGTAVESFSRVGKYLYALREDGGVELVRYDRERARRCYDALISADKASLQREAHRLIPVLMREIQQCRPADLLGMIQSIMEDRSNWETLLREDVLEFLLAGFFDDPALFWKTLWTLFNFRGTSFRCAICMCSTVRPDAPVCMLSKCAHRFHYECVQRMVAAHPVRNEELRQQFALECELNCPTCRTAFKAEDVVIDRQFTELVEYDSD